MAVAACDHVDEVEGVVHSPDGQLKAVYTYFNNGVMVSDDGWVRVYARQGAGWGEPCSAFRGAYGEVVGLAWHSNNELTFQYKPGPSAKIARACQMNEGNRLRLVTISATEIPRETAS